MLRPVPRAQCQVCKLPPEVLEAVNKELLKPENGRGHGRPLRVIEAELGKVVSRSALSRHLNNCLWRAKLNRYRDRRQGGQQHTRICVFFPKTLYEPAHWIQHSPWHRPYDEPEPFHGPFEKGDLILVITPERGAPIRNPSALRSPDEHAKWLSDFEENRQARFNRKAGKPNGAPKILPEAGSSEVLDGEPAE
jgi:hypothetical protein